MAATALRINAPLQADGGGPSVGLSSPPSDVTWPEDPPSVVIEQPTPDDHDELGGTRVLSEDEPAIASIDPLRKTVARATPGNWRPASEAVRLATGELIPGTRYELVRWLGEGGMGVVFEALHVDLRRPVALKILKSGTDEPEEARERFLREARAIARIDSEFVIEVLDFGELPDGRPFYTMELLDPHSLHQALKQDGPLPLERALPILRQCCKALAATHATGFVHRDIKPENILLQPAEAPGETVRLVDFGICAALDSHPRVAGTVFYMAPEQLRDGSFDARVDIYALGCMAMEMFTGAPPFAGDNHIEVANAHLDTPPPRLRDRRAALPAELDEVIARCLAKDPADRYANIQELEAALCRVQIATGVVTSWDNLALPEVEADERAWIRRHMPRRRNRQLRHLRRHAFVMCGTAGLLSVLLAFSSTPSVSANTDTAAVAVDDASAEVEALVDEAHAAGSRAQWVYPAAKDPEGKTALAAVLALESLEGPSWPLARARAQTLRGEFRDTLVRLGDRYWDHPHGEPFAAEFYAQALLFDPDHSRSRERAGMSSPQLANFENRIREGRHTDTDKQIGEALCVLAEEDEGLRRARAAELLAASEAGPGSLRVDAELAQLVGVTEVQGPSQARGSAAAAQVNERERELDEQDGGEGSERADEGPRTVARAKNDSKRALAATLTNQGQQALARGQRGQARELFERALSHRRNHSPAYLGLAEIFFAKGEYELAMRRADKAAQLAPRDVDALMLLGDASYRSGQLGAARAAYSRAKALGSGRAASRLARLEGRP